MKLIKALGLAALVTLMAMAFVGASSAMAETTALCTVEEDPCAKGNLVTHVHETTLAGLPAILSIQWGYISCSTLFLSTSVGKLSGPQTIAGNFTYSGCVMHRIEGGTANCTVTEQNGPSEIKILKQGKEQAEGESVEEEVHIRCGLFINCVYSLNSLYGWEIKGPLAGFEANGEVWATIPLYKVTGLCSTYEPYLEVVLTPLNATYISS